MKIYFVFNLRAGKGLVKTNLSEILNIFSAAGHEVTVYSTQSSSDARKKIEELPEGIYDRVICAGGDGTLDEVVSGMNKRKEKLPVGYIPAGSTNDFAVSLGLPKKMKEAAKVAISDNLFLCDVGGFNDTAFVYVAAFGLFTEVSYETPQEIKNVLGHTAYIFEGLKRLQDIRSYEMTVEVNGETITGEFIYGMVTNSQSVGGFKNIIGGNVDLSDGLFEVNLIKRPENYIELNETIASLLAKDTTAKGILSFKTPHIKFISNEPVAWTLDGEFGGKETVVDIVNLEKTLEIAIK